MKTLRILGVIALTAAGCATLPPNGMSHARFVRGSDAGSANRVGFATGVLATEETLKGPVVDGTYVGRVSDSYDASVVVHDGLAHYEGLIRPVRGLGFLHGLGIGFPSISSAGYIVALSASLGAWAQIGPSFFASLSYAPLLALTEESSEAVHFFNAEVGFAFSGDLQFAPTLVVSYVKFGDSADAVLPLQGVLNLSVLLGK